MSKAAERLHLDLLITNGTVITVDAQRRIYSNGAVAVDGNRIVAAILNMTGS